MEETHEMQKLHGFMQCLIYLSIALEVAVFVYIGAPFWSVFSTPLIKIASIVIYRQVIFSKLLTLLLICLVSIGTLSKKNLSLDPKKHILYPLAFGLLLFFG